MRQQVMGPGYGPRYAAHTTLFCATRKGTGKSDVLIGAARVTPSDCHGGVRWHSWDGSNSRRMGRRSRGAGSRELPVATSQVARRATVAATRARVLPHTAAALGAERAVSG